MEPWLPANRRARNAKRNEDFSLSTSCLACQGVFRNWKSFYTFNNVYEGPNVLLQNFYILHIMFFWSLSAISFSGGDYSRTSIKRPPFKRPPSIKRPFFKVPNYFNVSKLQYSIPLLNGQPLLSSQFPKSRGWPLNRGVTVFCLTLFYFQTVKWRR